MKRADCKKGDFAPNTLTHGVKQEHFGVKLEQLAMRLFIEAGYDVSAAEPSTHMPFDFQASDSNHIYCVQCKASSSLYWYHRIETIDNSLNVIKKYISSYNGTDRITPVLMVFALIPENLRKEIERICSEVIILDLPIILYNARGTCLETDIIAALPFSVENVEKKEGREKERGLNLSFLMHSSQVEECILGLKSCPVGQNGCYEYENWCLQALKILFANSLDYWQTQKRADGELHRVDTVCRVKDGVESSFWRMIEYHFNSKYIVFEYKNYEKAITQKEIYSTERYLYAKALRSVAIVIARNGMNDHAQWAAMGSLREQTKLILVLTNSELISMLEDYRQMKDPSLLLQEKLDELLIGLEK